VAHSSGNPSIAAPFSNLAEVVSHLVLWGRREGGSLARVEYIDENARRLAVAELFRKLGEEGVPVHEIDLPAALGGFLLPDYLKKSLSGISSGLVSISGFAVAMPDLAADSTKMQELGETIYALNFSREPLAAFPLRQIWWVPPHIADVLIQQLPDLNSWFGLRLQLEHATPRVRRGEERGFERIGMDRAALSPDEARRLAASSRRRFDKALSAGERVEALVELMAAPAVRGLAAAGLLQEAHRLKESFIEELESAGHHEAVKLLDGLVSGSWPADQRKGVSDRPTLPEKPCNLPFPPLGELFVGREKDFEGLHSNLKGGQAVALFGLGGVGKTRLAIEYAWRHKEEYSALLFVGADSPESLRSNLVSLAGPEVLNLAEQAVTEDPVKFAAVLRWLNAHTDWLLILDNVDTEEAASAVEDFLPKVGGGNVLITSRRTNWSASVRVESLDVIAVGDARDFLLKRTEAHRRKQSDDAEKAREIAGLLDGLPLALEQAAAYIAHHRLSFTAYLLEWEEKRKEVLEWHSKQEMQYPRSVAVTWQTTISSVNPAAHALLRLCAFLAPEPIPIAMFEKSKELLRDAAGLLCEETKDQPPRESVDLQGLLADLEGYSLIGRNEDGTAFTVHRMLQEVVRSRIPDARHRSWLETALKVVDEYAPGDPSDVRNWPVWESIYRHVATISSLGDEAGIPEPTGDLMDSLGLFLRARALYRDAESLLRRALAINEKHRSPDDPIIATCLNHLALVLNDTNRLEEAETLFRRALAIAEAAYGPDHPAVAIDLNNLALLLMDTNRLEEAETLFRRALAIDEAAYGPDHPAVATKLSNLASLLFSTNHLEEVEPHFRRALAIDEAAYGPDHPSVATNLNNLALLLKYTNRLEEAETLFRRAIAIHEASYGPGHPAVAPDLNNLGSLLRDTNRLEDAEPLFRRALAIQESSFVPDHPRTLKIRENLDLLLKKMGKSE
jgi:tetratricopeptide (TPR) repeat protein